ncbi:MAG TPA: chemotaxis response regulator protein-glutamate methylesterase [Candidatus Dormibacteraeota bacterium]|nr:chemotaxis response regulator protein-glutamate methylesterase [Candidatus Dormibacteraeota bacterium]
MTPIRILVVDDSVVIRKLLSDALSGDHALEVVGVASDGRIALAKIPHLKPDLITLDIEMPVMNGLETLTAVRKLYPKLPVIMFSTLTARGAAATLDALSLGASDYATKPSNTGSPAAAMERIRAELIPKIKVLCGILVPLKLLPLPGCSPAVKLRVRNNPRIEIVAIGSSTGGPNALAEVLPRIPNDFPVPIVVVQHMPPIFTSLLAERLASRSAIPVEEGRAGVALSPGHAWIAPGNFHMKVVRGVNWRLDLNQDPQENSCRPAVDVLFRSVAKACGGNVLGVVMTGMGSDGVLGALAIRDAGGDVIIQDEASSVVWGMPGLVHASGLDDAAYPLDHLAPEIIRRVLQSRGSRTHFQMKTYAALEPPAK